MSHRHPVLSDPDLDPHFDPCYERRVAWLTALWMAMALLAAAAEVLSWV